MNACDLLIYAVSDRHWLGDGEPLNNAITLAIEGGATFIQLREKTLPYREFLAQARQTARLCKEKNVKFVVNDNVEIAKLSNADGVHIGQGDETLANARKILGKDKIIGVSVQTVQQALQAERGSADYLGVGAMFKTSSKDDAEIVSFNTLREICSAVKIPVVAIGGINLENLKLFADTGISGIAVISALFGQKDIKKATAQLRTAAEQILK